MELKKYVSKRDFQKTPEPRGKLTKSRPDLIYVIQEHHARRLHYDLRLEFRGVLKSWAVPKGPSLDPKDKRLAVEVEDHPIEYASFEGEIPKGEYGAGQVMIWDSGTWIPPKNPAAAFKKGHIDFEIKGEKLRGNWTLVRLKGNEKNWLLFKRQDVFARTNNELVACPPGFVKPQLAQLVEQVPSGAKWLYEIKFDGYRLLCRIDSGQVQLLTRSGRDWTSKFKFLAKSAAKIAAKNALIDGELVYIDEDGGSHFQKLQNAISEKKDDHLVYYAFDLLFLDGKDLRELSLLTRKEFLFKLIEPLKKSPILFSQHWRSEDHAGGHKIFREACKLGLEGIISKDSAAPYFSGRSGLWQKTKCSLRQEFVICGYTDSMSAHRLFGALVLGAYSGQLRYVGRVGTGFSESTFRQLKPRLRLLRQAQSPFSVEIPGHSHVHWLKPKLIAEVEFKTWTEDGLLRQASFQGLRDDKKTSEVEIEVAGAPAVNVTHPERIIYPKEKITKLEVFKYYEEIASYLLPFVEDRPLSILRCQNDVTRGCFFQKRADERSRDSAIKSKIVSYKEKQSSAIVIKSQYDLLELVQAGTIEIHAWGTQFSHMAKPDQMVFDLDPDSPKIWSEVVESAHKIREMLSRLGLKSFIKVTGGKGLHIHVPIAPRYSWEQVKLFSKSLMKVLEGEAADHYTTIMTKAKRRGRIYLDYMRNSYGATAITPYSLRARETPSIALPILWKDVKTSLSSDQFVYPEALKFLKNRRDPWQDFWNLKQIIQVLESPGSHRGRAFFSQ